VFLIGILPSLEHLASYLYEKFQWLLNDWMNGECSNPFVKSVTGKQQQRLEEKDAQIEALMARIETLETIVTEPAYELNKKINALK
ncbi:MAG: hypothetical protein VYE21_00965, partial [Pseudomonadota bacterium]|nr:hypothetical protein [Pseudomonadota bacterium]